MPTKEKRTTAKKKQAPNNIPFYHSYPHYEYIPPPIYDPVYMYPRYPYESSDYIYYPVNEYGQIIGPPTNFPPIINPHYREFYPYSDYISNIPTHGSYVHSPRRYPTLYEDYYYHHPHFYRSYEKTRHGSLPPIKKHVCIIFLFLLKIKFSFLLKSFTSSRLVSRNDDQHQQFVVRNLTEDDSRSPKLSYKNAIGK
jgi:hypothetical protein